MCIRDSIYGAQEEKADATYRVPGAFRMVKNRFPKITALSEWQVAFAERYGYVETIPDRSVDPDRGYPLMCSRTESGYVKPTVPFNYHVSGTAMQWTDRAMIRTHDFLKGINNGERFAGRKWLGGYYLTMQVHDELVFDFPSGDGKGENPWDYNLPLVREVQRLMERGGDDIGVPTPVSVEYHPENWAMKINL